MIDIFDSQTKLGSMCEDDAKLLLELRSKRSKTGYDLYKSIQAKVILFS